MDIFDLFHEAVHHVLGGTSSRDLADLGADPHQVLGAGQGLPDSPVSESAQAFPDMGGSSVMDQVNQAMATATQSYREGMDSAGHAPVALSAGDQAQQLIDGVMHASPEQLARMGQQVQGLSVSEGIRESVAEARQQLLDDNAHHDLLRAADSDEIHAKAVAAAAQAALDRARYL